MQFAVRHYGPLSANIRQGKIDDCSVMLPGGPVVARRGWRWHSVRGHFKIRKTGVYWWSPFYRVDPTKQTVRQEYKVE
jgi:hypothetical protein